MKCLLLLLLAGALHAAGPVRCAFDAKVVDWNYRCVTNNIYSFTYGNNGYYSSTRNQTHSLIASSVWMGAVRSAGLYPGNILRANLMCGASYNGTNGAGDCVLSACTNLIGSPQVPLINDTGGGMDLAVGVQYRWKYQETGTGGGLGCVSTNSYVVLNTGIMPTNVSAWKNDVHACIYMTIGGVENSVLMGASDVASTNVFAIETSYTTVGQASLIWFYLGNPASVDTDGTGLYLGTRTSGAANGVTQYHNGVSTGSSSSVSGDPAYLPFTIYVLGYNYAGTPLYSTARLCGGYALGRGLTATQNTNYYNAWQKFETLLGRQK